MGNSAEDVDDHAVNLARVGLTRDGGDALKAHFLGDEAVELAALFVVAAEQLEKARLGARGALAAEQSHAPDAVFKLVEVEQQVVEPEGRALADGGGLRRLEVGKRESRLSAVLLGKLRKLAYQRDELGADKLKPLAHDDDVGVVADVAAGSAQVNDSLCLGALNAESVDVRHNVVAAFLFAL